MIQLFSQDQDALTDFSKVGAAGVFNQQLAPTFNRVERTAVSAGLGEVDLDGENAAAAQRREGQAAQDDAFFKEQGAQDDRFLKGQSASSVFGDNGGDGGDTVIPVSDTPQVASSGSFADFTFEREARKDQNGNLAVFKPPSGDGGGSFEVAGITQKFQPKEAAQLKRLIQQGRSGEAEKQAKQFFKKRAQPFVKHTSREGLKLQLTDTVHHRGEGGLRRVLQRATGSKARSSATLIRQLSKDPKALAKFNKARVDYELKEVDRGRASRVKFRRGLLNRFKQANIAATKLES